MVSEVGNDFVGVEVADEGAAAARDGDAAQGDDGTGPGGAALVVGGGIGGIGGIGGGFNIGGGIAGLAAAFYLIRDGHMPGANITVYDATTFEQVGDLPAGPNAELGQTPNHVSVDGKGNAFSVNKFAPEEGEGAGKNQLCRITPDGGPLGSVTGSLDELTGSLEGISEQAPAEDAPAEDAPAA